VARRVDAPIGVALAFSLLILLIQISLHLSGMSGLFPGATAGPQTGIGILYNLPDSLSYASWAAQARLGHLTFSDLFTTEPHSSALFNLYFLLIGFLSRILGIDPLTVMQFSSLLLGPLSVFAVLSIARQLKFDTASQVLSIVFVFLGAGLSGLFILLDAYGLPSLHYGSDAYYLDLFPLPNLAFYPYHAVTFVLLALIVLVSIKVLTAEGGPGPGRRALLLGALFLIVGFIRPYEAVTLALVFNLTALFGTVTGRGVPLGKTLKVCAIVDVLAFPPVAYAAFVATRPVWRSFAETSMIFETAGAVGFLKGFAVLWGLGALGLAFAIADRKRDLSFVAGWAIVSTALLLLSPHYGTKFAGCGALADGLLAAYGIERLLHEGAARGWRGAAQGFVVCTIGVMVLTPVAVFANAFKLGVPRVDSELLAAGKRIRELEGTSIPVVLTDPVAGAVLPGLFGERVYAGHWSLTPGFRRKAEQLKKAGIDPAGSGDASYDRALLSELVRASGANYLLLQRSAPAAQALATYSLSPPVFEGERWIAVSAARWSCP